MQNLNSQDLQDLEEKFLKEGVNARLQGFNSTIVHIENAIQEILKRLGMHDKFFQRSFLEKEIFEESLSILGENLKLYDSYFQKKVQSTFGHDSRLLVTGTDLEGRRNQVCNGFILFGKGITYNNDEILKLNSGFKELTDRVEFLKDTSIETKLMSKYRKNKRKINQKIFEEKNNILSVVKDNQNSSTLQFQELESKMLEIERKCLWRIEEHEKMINQKVSQKYLDDSVASIEQTIKQDIINVSRTNQDNIARVSFELNEKISQLSLSLSEKIRNNRQGIQDINNRLSEYCLDKDFRNYQEIQKLEIKKIWDYINSPQSTTFDPKKINKQIYMLEEQTKNIIIELENLKQNQSKNVVQTIVNKVEDGDLSRSRKSSQTTNAEQTDLNPRLTRVEIEVKIYSEQCQKLLMEVQRYHILENNITILTNKVDALSGLEKRFNSMLQSFNLTSINQQLAMKVDRGEYDKRFIQIENDIMDLKNDLDYLVSFYKKIVLFLDQPDAEIPEQVNQIQSFQQKGVNPKQFKIDTYYIWKSQNIQGKYQNELKTGQQTEFTQKEARSVQYSNPSFLKTTVKK